MNVYEPTEEGWGKVFADMGGFASSSSYEHGAKVRFNQVMKAPEIVKYVAKYCDEFFKDCKKDGFVKANGKANLSKLTASQIGMKNQIFNHFFGPVKIGGYIIWGVGDIDHVEKLEVQFYNPKTEKYKYYKIPQPTDENLKKIGFRKEDIFD